MFKGIRIWALKRKYKALNEKIDKILIPQLQGKNTTPNHKLYVLGAQRDLVITSLRRLDPNFRP